MERRRLKPVRLFSSDIDGTLTGSPEAGRRFAAFWEGLAPERRPLLAYNSGRLVEDILEFGAQESLPRADVVIGGVGTMIAADGHPHLASDYAEAIRAGYDAAAVEAVLGEIEAIARQPERYQHTYKSSWHFHDATPESLMELESRLAERGLSVRIVYSSNRDLDILPANADKGMALRWLCERFGIGLDEVVVAGDSGNDGGMFALEGVRGIVPKNALPELRRQVAGSDLVYHATRPEADGVIEGLRHWRIGL